MSNSHFRVVINQDAYWAKHYLLAFLLHHYPGVQIQDSNVTSDYVHCIIDGYNSTDAQNMEMYRNVPNVKIIAITGEPCKITANFVHLIIDCKRDPSLRPKNIPFVYLPFYVMSFAERETASPCDLLLPYNFDAKKVAQSKTKFCAYMYSNPIQFRDELFDAVAKYQQPDALGSCRSNKLRHETDRIAYDLKYKTYYELAVEKYKPYKFVIACENSRIDGYVTEKLMNAVLARCVPIYLGAPDIFNDGVFNPKAMIHVADFSSYETCVAHIKRVNESPELYEAYLREPIFIGNNLPNVFYSNYILSSFQQVFDTP